MASRNAADRQHPPKILVDDQPELDQVRQRRFTQMRLRQQNKAIFQSAADDASGNLSVPTFSRKAAKLAPLKPTTQTQ